jgi:hypothetical protein
MHFGTGALERIHGGTLWVQLHSVCAEMLLGSLFGARPMSALWAVNDPILQTS